ncbi:MAG: helix-turn-helix transcriptional regulator [Myxococcota bacterium]
MSTTLFRTIEMLRLLPRAPKKISTSELRQRLADAGYKTTIRTIQRDLQKLSTVFPLVSDERNHPFGWSWSKDSRAESLPGMDAPTALTFTLVEQYLKDMLPAGVLDLMQPHFQQARSVLETNGNGLLAWRDKIRVLPRAQPLVTPPVDSEIARNIYDALLQDRRLRAMYQPRSGEARDYLLSPHGLAFRDAVIYLVASQKDYDNVVMFALHRFLAVEPTDEPRNVLPDFDFDEWIERGGFDADKHDGHVRLVARFDPAVGDHLAETPLEGQRSLVRVDDGRLELTADVKDTHQLRWWLRGFGPDVEVVSPTEIRAWIREGAAKMAAMYS